VDLMLAEPTGFCVVGRLAIIGSRRGEGWVMLKGWTRGLAVVGGSEGVNSVLLRA